MARRVAAVGKTTLRIWAVTTLVAVSTEALVRSDTSDGAYRLRCREFRRAAQVYRYLGWVAVKG